MNLGISTACFYPELTEVCLEKIGKSGIKYTEVFFNASVELEKDFVKELKKIKDYYGISVGSVHPTMSLAESFMLFSNYKRRFDEGMDWYKRYGEIAAELGAKYVIMHGGKPNTAIDDQQYFERFAKVSEHTKANGGTLLQENVVTFRASSLETQKNMINALGDTAKFCLDIKQCIRGGYTPFDALEVMGNHIKHIHISDHTCNNDCLLPTKGDFDFKKFFDEAEQNGYSGNAMIEVYRNAYQDEAEVFSALSKLKADLKIIDR